MAMPRDKPRSLVRWGAFLIAIGAIFWLVQGGLLLAALPTVSSAFNLDGASSTNNTTGAASATPPTHLWLSEHAVTKALGTFVFATVFSVVATLALAVGSVLIARGAFAGLSTSPPSGPALRFSRRTRNLGFIAGGFIAAFAVCGFVALGVLARQGGATLPSGCGGWGDGCAITTAVELWIVGSALLLVGSEIFEVFTERLGKESRGRIRIHGAPFSNYAIVNFVALAVVPFAVVTGPTNGGLSDSLLYAVLFAQLFVVPVTGFVAWSWVAVHGFQSASRHAAGAAEPEGDERGPGEVEPEFPQPRSPRSTPALASMGSSDVRSVAVTAGGNPLDPDWVLRIQTRVRNLERLVVAQNETITQFRNYLVRLPAETDNSGALPTTRIGRIEPFGPSSGTASISPGEPVPPGETDPWSGPLPEVPKAQPRAPNRPPDGPT